MNKFILVYLLTSFIGFSCTPFNSDKNNKRLIQSTWAQVEIAYLNEKGDSLIVEQPETTTLLTFSGDSCFEKMKDMDVSIHYIFDIKDYVLKLEIDSARINYLDIRKLTNDSLILHSNYRLWKYIKKTD